MFIKGSPIDFSKVRKVLLVQLGDIGDVVWTEPTIRAFRETFPSVEVSVLARGGFGELLVAHPDVHRLFNIAPVKGGILAEITAQSALVGKLRRERFDIVFDLRAGDRGAVMAWLTGAPCRVSLYYAQDIPFWRNSLFTHIVDPPPLETLVQGAAEQTLRIVREFGIDTADRAPRLRVSEEVRRRVSVILQEVGLEGAGRWVSVNPFSRWSYKEWPHERWVPVLNGLWERHRLPAVLVGSPDERREVSRCWHPGCRVLPSTWPGRPRWPSWPEFSAWPPSTPAWTAPPLTSPPPWGSPRSPCTGPRTGATGPRRGSATWWWPRRTNAHPVFSRAVKGRVGAGVSRR